MYVNVATFQMMSRVQHPNYSETANGYPNDIAVLGFSSIATNANVGFISLATTADGNYAGASCVITGWGLTAAGAPCDFNQTTILKISAYLRLNCQSAANGFSLETQQGLL